jgi:3-oxoacyl-[acyl-carrier protein] reductase
MRRPCSSVISTTSGAGLLNNPGQANYSSAKAGIVALTLATARACERYGVKANAICPRARTAMTAGVFGDAPEGTDPLSVDHVAPLVAFLASPAAEDVSGQVFVAYGGMVVLVSAPGVEQRFDSGAATWTTEALATDLGGYFAQRDNSVTFAADAIARL